MHDMIAWVVNVYASLCCLLEDEDVNFRLLLLTTDLMFQAVR